eukprot:10317093-Ditylum_brightwellii.AAC.1
MKSAQDKFHAQSQIRRNAEECNDYLRDLLAWEEEKRGKEAELCRKTSNHNVDDGCTKKHVTLDKIKCIHQEPPKTNKSLINSSALLPNNEKPHLALDCYHEVGTAMPKPRRPVEHSDNEERQRGNKFYESGDYGNAVKSYTQCIVNNSRSAVAFSNR